MDTLVRPSRVRISGSNKKSWSRPENGAEGKLLVLKGSDVRSSNGSGILESRESTVRRLLMPDEPDSNPFHSIVGGCDRLEIPPDQEVNRLFDEMHAPLRRYMMFLGLSPEDADDGVQEAFLRLHKHVGSRGDRTNLRGWLFQVVRNFARDKRKSAWTRRTSMYRQDHERLSSVEDPQDSPEERLLKEEKLGWLRSAIERLTPQQVECLQLRVAGFKYREIAGVMGIGISAVGELVQRAMSRLNEDSHGY
jgi:RNA polymerase sigma-70 factor (ECF subfamily)